MTTLGEALIHLLEAHGVDTVFGIPGVHTVELYRGLADSKIRHVTPRHEQGAGFMADGYARASGKPGVAFVITGPGLTNTITAMGQARADSVFTHDPSLSTDHGAIILSMGKALRRPEPGLHEEAYRRMGVPILGRIEAPGTLEGGDCVWVDAGTLAIGRGVRSNETGIRQMAALLQPHGIEVLGYDLPLWHGEEACLHLMSVISPLADDLALVHSPLLPAAFYQLLRARGIRLVEGDAKEFHDSFGLSLNVLPTAPREVIAVAGFPKTSAAMEAAGCRVRTFEADALCIACEGGPTCLTRPVWRG